MLPSTPRCGYCGAPFAGVGARLARPLGYRPSRKNPNLCSTCVELAPPGGMTAEIGVLFADLRGFTSDSESRSPAEVGIELRRFYAHAGEAFIGNIGGTAVHDFTAVGDVVNTASRLQAHAAAGEVLLSARLAHLLPEPVGAPEQLLLKGKQEPFDVRRVRWFAKPT